MAFENLREQLKEKWSEFSAKIQETSAFNSAREKYESQTPAVQRAIIFGALGFVALIILSFPMSYISSSGDYLSQFQDNRNLIQGLLRASRSAKETPPLPPPMPYEALRSNVDRALREKGLLADQIGDMQAIPNTANGIAVPAAIIQTGLAVQVKKINVTQIIELANAIGNMGAGNKLVGMDIVQTQGQTHYYDVILKVMNYGLPVASVEDEGPGPGKNKHTPPKSHRPQPEEETNE